MAKVVKHDGETVDSLLKRFKQAVKKEEILYECKKRQYFLSTAEKAEEKRAHARTKVKHRKKINF